MTPQRLDERERTLYTSGLTEFHQSMMPAFPNSKNQFLLVDSLGLFRKSETVQLQTGDFVRSYQYVAWQMTRLVNIGAQWNDFHSG